MLLFLKKIFIPALCIIALGTVIYAGFFFYKRNALDTPTQTTSETPSQATVNVTQNTPDVSEENTPHTTDSSSDNPSTPLAPSSTDTNTVKPPSDQNTQTSPFIPDTLSSANTHAFLPLSKMSCGKNCNQFTKDTEIQYCREYCGFETFSTIENCTDLHNLEQDYCLKGMAIDKTDPTICKKIADDNIRAACQNRVLEDVVDKIQSE